MEYSKRIWYAIGIGLIILMLGFIIIAKAISEKNLLYLLEFILIILFAFSGYWRLYQFYNLEKLLGRHTRKDFIDYFNNLSFVRLLFHSVIPIPLFKKFLNQTEEKIRVQINIWTAILWVSYGFMSYCMEAFNN
jgi:hypothetical protein